MRAGRGKHEVAAILELKREHPSMGPAQLREQSKRFKGWRVSFKAIARLLHGRGYEPVHRGSKPKGPEPVRFEAPWSRWPVVVSEGIAAGLRPT